MPLVKYRRGKQSKEHRKQCNIQYEQERRGLAKDGFNNICVLAPSLCVLVPCLNGRELSKSIVLEKATK